MSDTGYPLASIIIPVYNGSDYVKDAIDSALFQSYGNIEVIVVNDGSKDNNATRNVALSYSDRIKYIEKENGGVASALNLGIRESSGDWIYWLSHDDYYHKDRVLSDMAFVNKNPDAKVLFSDFCKVNEDREIKDTIQYTLSKITSLKELIDNNSLHFCTMTLSRYVYKEVGYFNEYNKSNQDVEMTFKLACNYNLYHIPETLTYVRDLTHLNIRKFNSKQFVSDLSYLADYLYNHAEVENFFPDTDKSSPEYYKSLEFIGYFYAYLGAIVYAKEYFSLAKQFISGAPNKLKFLIRVQIHLLKRPSNRYWIFYFKYLLAKIK